MNILFYVEPLIEKQMPYWKEGWVNYLSWSLINTLRKSESKYNFCILTNEPIASTVDSDKNLSLIVVKQSELLQPFGGNYFNASSAWHIETYSAEQMRYYENLMKIKLDDFVPDVIITFTPVPFLSKLFPDTLVLHHEYSIFSRLPFPMSWFLDPIGVISKSYFNRFQSQIANIKLSKSTVECLIGIKQQCVATLSKRNPFENCILDAKSKFHHLVFLPLQDSGHYSFDDLVPFKSQYEYCVYVLDNTPESIGVVVNTHPEYPVLSKDAIKFLRWKYPHFIYLDEFNTVYASGQFILPFALAQCIQPGAGAGGYAQGVFGGV